jgi:hypothetical protein
MSYNLFINSADRIYTNEPSTNFSVFDISDMYANQEKDIALSQITIPNSIYSINDNNNTFILTSLDLGATDGLNVSLSNGNYNNNSFITELTTQLDALSLGATFTASISSTQQKLSITSSTGDFTITADNQNYIYLGLDKSNSKSSSSSVWISDNVIDLSGTRYIDFIIDIPLASNNNKNLNKNILSRIWKNADNFDTIFYKNNDFNFVKMLTTSFNGLRITLLDEWGNIVDLNGMNWDCVLELRLQN